VYRLLVCLACASHAIGTPKEVLIKIKKVLRNMIEMPDNLSEEGGHCTAGHGEVMQGCRDNKSVAVGMQDSLFQAGRHCTAEHSEVMQGC